MPPHTVTTIHRKYIEMTDTSSLLANEDCGTEAVLVRKRSYCTWFHDCEKDARKSACVHDDLSISRRFNVDQN